MKLRSGKILLPPVIEKKLFANLKEFKTLLANNKGFGKDLIKVIAIDPSIEKRFLVNDMIREQFPDVELRDGLGVLLATSGDLLRLVTGYGQDIKVYNEYPEIYTIIQERILTAFNIDVSLIGIDHQVNMEI